MSVRPGEQSAEPFQLQRNDGRSTDKTLTLSVIVPTYNDAHGLRETVQSLVRQNYPVAKYEVVVVDNGSTDDTLAVARALAGDYPDLVSAVEEKSVQSSYAARNKGIVNSTGEILCFLDSDMTVEPNYLSQISARFAAGDVAYLGQAVKVVVEEQSVAAGYNQAQGFPIEAYMRQQHFAGAGCLAVRRDLMEAVGAFDSRLESSGDLEFGQRVHAAGYRQDFAGEIVLNHPARASYRSLIGKARRLGRGDAQLRYHLPGRYGSRMDRYRRPSYYLPNRPWAIREQYIAAGRQISIVSALCLSLWALPLKWTRPLAAFREFSRLRARAGKRAPGGQRNVPLE